MKILKALSVFYFLFFNISALIAQNLLAFDSRMSNFEKGKIKNEFIPTTSKPTDKFVFIDFVGTGDIQKSLSQGDGITANTGLGIIFERYNGEIQPIFTKSKNYIQSLELEAVINIASTADSIRANFNNNKLENRRSFGTYILNPISQKQSLFLNANVIFGYPDKWFFKKITPIISGINIRLITSNSVWAYEDNFQNLGVLALRAGVFHEFIPDNFRIDEKGRSKYSLFAGINYSYRGIYGDISANQNEEFLKNVLGNTETNFNGFDFNFGFRLNNLRAEFEMPTLRAKNVQIEGLTNTQFVFSIKFVGGFSLKIDEKSISETTSTNQ